MQLIKPNDRKFIKKGWGGEDFIYNGEYCGKLLIFNKDKKLSLHFHRLKQESFFCSNDSEIELIVYDNPELDKYIIDWDNLYNGVPNAPKELTKPEKFIMRPGDSFNVPIGLRHTMMALRASTLIEFSTTDYDDDSVRILKGN